MTRYDLVVAGSSVVSLEDTAYYVFFLYYMVVLSVIRSATWMQVLDCEMVILTFWIFSEF